MSPTESRESPNPLAEFQFSMTFRPSWISRRSASERGTRPDTPEPVPRGKVTGW